MTPVWVHNDENFRNVARFVSTRIWGAEETFLGNTAVGIVSDSGLVAGVVFHNYDPRAGVMEMSAASDTKRWMTRPILFEMFSYVFDQMGCQATVLRCDPSNTSLGRILTAYGFTKHIIPRLRGRNTPEAVFVLGDDDWRMNGFHKEHRNG